MVQILPTSITDVLSIASNLVTDTVDLFTNITTGIIKIGNNTSGTITIGGTGAMTLNGAITASTSLTSTGMITANGGLMMGPGKNITLQPNSGYVVPETTNWSQIGSINSTTTTITTVVQGWRNMVSISITTGIWIINANMQQRNGVASLIGLTINTTPEADSSSLITTHALGTLGTITLHTSRFVINSTSTAIVYNLVGYSNVSQTMYNLIMSAIRIA